MPNVGPRIHGLRGRPSNRRLPDELHRQVVTLYAEWSRRGVVRVGEFLQEIDRRWPGRVSVSTLRRWLRLAGFGPSGRRTHRSQQRPGARAFLVELPGACLLVDGATGEVLAAEPGPPSGERWTRLLGICCGRYGIPERCLGRLTGVPEARRFRRLLERLGVQWSSMARATSESMPLRVQLSALAWARGEATSTGAAAAPDGAWVRVAPEVVALATQDSSVAPQGKGEQAPLGSGAARPSSALDGY